MAPYDSPDYHALIRNIRHLDRAGQDSTLARLVTADWLEERGEGERAEYIRLKIEPQPADYRRRLDLFAQFGGVWFVPPEDLSQVGVLADGWVHQVTCPLDWWLAHGPDLCRRHPVREVVITGLTPAGGGSIDSDQVRGLARTIQKTSPFLADQMLNEAISGMDASSSGAFLLPIMNNYALLWAESEADRQHTA
jgi:uncharacterized protein (TIGR02996 family)